MSAEDSKAPAATAAPASPVSAALRSRLLLPSSPSGQSKYLRGAAGAYILDKQAVVIDFGSSSTKVGFASESRPQRIIPTPELRQRKRSGEIGSSTSHSEWVVILDRLLSQVFFTYLHVNPKDRKVVVCDAVLSPTAFRSALVFVLLKRLSVLSVAFVVDLVLPLYLTGLSSGIVIDLGYSATRVLPTFASVPVLSAFAHSFVGGAIINQKVRRSLKELASETDATSATAASVRFSESALEDITARACYVSFTYKGADDDKLVRLQSSNAVTLDMGKQSGVVTVPADVRWKATEVLFQPDSEDTGDVDTCSTVSEAFVTAVRSCPIDIRPKVLQNVVVCGGCASMKGLLPRLVQEIEAALLRDSVTAPLADKLMITPLDFAPLCAVWTGGSIYGSLEGIHEYTLSDYESGRLVKDWARDGFV